MRIRRKSEPERFPEMAGDAFAALRSGAHRGALLKAALVAGGAAALTAGSAAISSFRRRREPGS
jgi:hypothetical protein